MYNVKIDKVTIKTVDEEDQPNHSTDLAAGYDLKAKDSVLIKAGGGRALIKTGVYLDLPNDVEAHVRPRSGLALKHGITVLNTPGTIDADYKGEVGVILLNTDPESDFEVEVGDRIAQLVFNPIVRHCDVLRRVKDKESIELEGRETARGSDVNVRGSNGFGSTGV